MIDDKSAAKKFLKPLNEDDKLDLLMYLAEEMGLRIFKNEEDITYFIPTKPF